jgi:hypothetical protein
VQTSRIAGTLFQGTHLALTLWFLALDLISQAKTGLSALALQRPLGVSYPTAWLIQHKIMQAMTERDAQYTRCGAVRVDDAYLGGERVGGKAGRGSENKVPFVAAVSLNTEGHPLYTKMIPVPGFTGTALTDWAKAALAPRSPVIPFLYRFKFSRADKINGYPVREATIFCPRVFNCSQVFSCKSAKVLKFTQLNSFFRCCQTRSIGLISGL